MLPTPSLFLWLVVSRTILVFLCQMYPLSWLEMLCGIPCPIWRLAAGFPCLRGCLAPALAPAAKLARFCRSLANRQNILQSGITHSLQDSCHLSRCICIAYEGSEDVRCTGLLNDTRCPMYLQANEGENETTLARLRVFEHIAFC